MRTYLKKVNRVKKKNPHNLNVDAIVHKLGDSCSLLVQNH